MVQTTSRKEVGQFLNACTLDQFLFSKSMDDEDDPSATLDQFLNAKKRV
jgi:hypothetical protein